MDRPLHLFGRPKVLFLSAQHACPCRRLWTTDVSHPPLIPSRALHQARGRPWDRILPEPAISVCEMADNTSQNRRSIDPGEQNAQSCPPRGQSSAAIHPHSGSNRGRTNRAEPSFGGTDAKATPLAQGRHHRQRCAATTHALAPRTASSAYHYPGPRDAGNPPLAADAALGSESIKLSRQQGRCRI